MKVLILFLIKLYQNIWPFTGTACRFQPTCSHYTYDAIEKYGVLKGSLMGVARISRCNPWNKGGYDKVE